MIRSLALVLLATLTALGPALAAPPAPDAAPIRLTGSVRLPAGGPAAVTLELHPAWEETAAALQRLAGRAPAPLATARPDVAGRFELQAPGTGAYRMEARAAGSVPMAFQLPALVEEAELPPLALPPAVPLEVLAAGPDGKPAGGIEIRAETEVQLEHQGRVVWRPAVRTSRTGPDGRLVLPRAAGETALLTVLTPARLLAEPLRAGAGPVRLALPEPRPVVLAAAGPDGRPAAGALVRILPFDGLPAAVGVTGPDGRLPIAVPAGRDVWLLIEDGQGRLGEAILSPGHAGRKAPLEVRLEEPLVLRGRVLQAGSGSARPIAGALVGPEPAAGSGAPAVPRPPVRSAADGSFELRLPRGRAVFLHAAAAGHRERRAQPVRPGGGAARGSAATELRLQPAAALAGEVVDGAGRPVAGARLQTPRTWPALAPAWSSRDGRFRLAGLLPGGIYELTATHPNFPRTTVRTRTAPAGRPAEPLRIVLGPGRTVVGRVVDAAGQPLPGAELTLRLPFYSDEVQGVLPEDAEEPRRAAAGADGSFRFPRVMGRYELDVRRPGAAPLALPVDVTPGAGDLDLGPLVLESGLALEGRVVDSEGAPLAGAEVTWIRILADGSYTAEDPDDRRSTGPDGLFRIAGLAPGQRLDLAVRHPAHALRMLQQVEPSGTPGEPLEIVLNPARVLAGRVLGPAGEPVAGAQLFRSNIDVAGLRGGLVAGRSRIGSTEPDGRFRATGLEPGPLDLQVSAPGYVTRDVEGLTIPADRDLEGLEISLERGTTLEGRVTRNDGEPVPGILVRARGARGPFGRRPGSPPRPYRGAQHAVTGADGSYRIEGLAPGRYEVEAMAPGIGAPERAEIEIAAGAAPLSRLDIVLDEDRQGVTVAGRVVDEEGAPVPNAEVQLGSLDGRWGQSVLSLPDGSFRMARILDGAYRMAARGRGVLDSDPHREIRVVGQPVEGIELQLARAPDLTVTGRLLGLAPEEAARVRIDAWTQMRPQPGSVEPPNSYRVAGLYPGSWAVVAVHADGQRAEGTIELSADQPETVLDLTFPSGFTLAGRVAVDGAPLAGARIEVADAAGADTLYRQTRTAQDGTFEVRDLSPGRYRLLALDERSGIGAGRDVALEGDQTVLVDLATAPLRGQVLAPDGTPVAGATVLLMGRNDALGINFRVPPVRTDGEGAFGLAIAPGTYRATVEAEGYAAQEVDLEVRPQVGWTGEVRLEPAAGAGRDDGL